MGVEGAAMLGDERERGVCATADRGQRSLQLLCLVVDHAGKFELGEQLDDGGFDRRHGSEHRRR